MALEIRVANSTDMSAISALMKASTAKFIVPSLTKAAAEQLLMSLSEAPLRNSSAEVVYWIAERDGQLAGVLGIKAGAHVLHCFVGEGWHRRGIGGAMWRYVSKELSMQADRCIFTVNSSLYAVPFYQSLGFVAVADVVERAGVRFIPMQLTYTNTV